MFKRELKQVELPTHVTKVSQHTESAAKDLMARISMLLSSYKYEITSFDEASIYRGKRAGATIVLSPECKVTIELHEANHHDDKLVLAGGGDDEIA